MGKSFAKWNPDPDSAAVTRWLGGNRMSGDERSALEAATNPFLPAVARASHLAECRDTWDALGVDIAATTRRERQRIVEVTKIVEDVTADVSRACPYDQDRLWFANRDGKAIAVMAKTAADAWADVFDAFYCPPARMFSLGHFYEVYDSHENNCIPRRTS